MGSCSLRNGGFLSAPPHTAPQNHPATTSGGGNNDNPTQEEHTVSAHTTSPTPSEPRGGEGEPPRAPWSPLKPPGAPSAAHLPQDEAGGRGAAVGALQAAAAGGRAPRHLRRGRRRHQGRARLSPARPDPNRPKPTQAGPAAPTAAMAASERSAAAPAAPRLSSARQRGRQRGDGREAVLRGGTGMGTGPGPRRHLGAAAPLPRLTGATPTPFGVPGCRLSKQGTRLCGGLGGVIGRERRCCGALLSLGLCGAEHRTRLFPHLSWGWQWGTVSILSWVTQSWQIYYTPKAFMMKPSEHKLPEITSFWYSGAEMRAASQAGSAVPHPYLIPVRAQTGPQALTRDKSQPRVQLSLPKPKLTPKCCPCVPQPSPSGTATQHCRASIGVSSHGLPFMRDAVISRARRDKNKWRWSNSPQVEQEIWRRSGSRTWISCFPLLCFSYKYITPPTEMNEKCVHLWTDPASTPESFEHRPAPLENNFIFQPTGKGIKKASCQKHQSTTTSPTDAVATLFIFRITLELPFSASCHDL